MESKMTRFLSAYKVAPSFIKMSSSTYFWLQGDHKHNFIFQFLTNGVPTINGIPIVIEEMEYRYATINNGQAYYPIVMGD